MLSQKHTEQNIERPLEMDILCGSKSKAISRHPGNLLLQAKVEECVDDYMKANTKAERMTINRSIIQYMQKNCGSRFLKQTHDGTWTIAEEQAVRDKVSHAIRNACAKKQKETAGSRRLSLEEIRSGDIDNDVEDAEFVKMISDLYRRQQQILDDALANRFQEGVNISDLAIDATIPDIGVSEHGSEDFSESTNVDPELCGFLSDIFEDDDSVSSTPAKKTRKSE